MNWPMQKSDQTLKSINDQFLISMKHIHHRLNYRSILLDYQTQPRLHRG